ncbi:hypothetical protein OG858_46915 (plasmid) [Streptomyces europaeiscabiei]|uniref:hypothetical protein n=1 Tax=Streptomyces europaeiscabiei TaxID=146819 RepID=UPI002E805FFC|nr:hypothetical protein [Streptomyces europaeiscabiei]WUD38841.1 hypothetical protein OG858_46915 [Streptomyces europaeiscabiei]
MANVVRLKTTTDVVAWIAANVSQTIASAEIPGHDLDAVMAVMTSDDMLGRIRIAYVRAAAQGKDRPTVIKNLGVYLIARYYADFQLGN